MEKYEIIKIEFTTWNERYYLEGYHAIVSETSKKFRLCRIENGKPALRTNGEFSTKLISSKSLLINFTHFQLIEKTDLKGKKEFRINQKEIVLWKNLMKERINEKIKETIHFFLERIRQSPTEHRRILWKII